jgi:hypothetical protein
MLGYLEKAELSPTFQTKRHFCENILMAWDIGRKYLFFAKFLAKIYAKQEEMSAAAENFLFLQDFFLLWKNVWEFREKFRRTENFR